MAAAPWPVLCIMGPTACGKTELALAVAGARPADLISVDSALVYRGMDIGSAKPSRELRARHPHALVDIRDPADPYSAADFRRDALAAMEASRAAGRLPVLVGGTMLYFRVLEQGIAVMPEADSALRTELDARVEREGIDALHAELARLDPVAAERIHPRNAQRIKRALEVRLVSGRPISDWWAEQDAEAGLAPHWRPLRIGLVPRDRAALHRAIERRFDAMLGAGLMDEVRALRRRGDLDASLPALRAVGYRQAWAHLEGECDAEAMRERALAATRQLARRQLTWLRSWPGVERIEVDPGEPLPGSVIDGVLAKLPRPPDAAASGIP
jgi:tRNA dimethylallyltransferase